MQQNLATQITPEQLFLLTGQYSESDLPQKAISSVVADVANPVIEFAGKVPVIELEDIVPVNVFALIEIATFAALVILPCASTVYLGTTENPPYVPGVTPLSFNTEGVIFVVIYYFPFKASTSAFNSLIASINNGTNLSY